MNDPSMHVKDDCQLQDCLTYCTYILFFQKFQVNYKKGCGFTSVSLLVVLYVG